MAERKIQIELSVDDKGSVVVKNFADKTESGMKDVEKQSKTTTSRMKSQWEGVRKNWLAVTAALAGAMVMIKECTSLYMVQEKAEMQLGVAMKNAGTYTRENFQALKDYAAQLQKVTTYGDEVTIATMANLQTYGMETEALQQATKASMDLAAAKQIDLRTASELVGKAFVGETGTLSRYGIVLDEGKDKGEKFAAVLRLINDRFGGSAQAEIETYGGQLKQIANWWGDIKEMVGYGLLKALEAVQMAFGMVGAGFYIVLETIVKGYRMLAETVAKIPGMGNVMAPLIDHLNTIEKGFRDAKTAALDFASTNMTMLMSGDRTSSYLDKLAAGAGPPENAGGTDDAKVQALADEKAKALAVELAQRQQFFADLNEAADIYNQGLQEREDLRMQQTAERLQAEYDMRTQFFNDINEAEYMADRMRADYKEQLAREDADRERILNQAKLSMAMNYAQTAMNVLGAIASFSKEQNTAMFLVSKAVAAAMTWIQGNQAAIAAASAVAGIPVVGPALAEAAYARMMILTYINMAAIAATAIGQLATGSAGSASSPSVTGVGYGPYQPASETVPTQEKEAVSPIQLTVQVFGDVVDHSEFARTLVPYLKKAYKDGVH